MQYYPTLKLFLFLRYQIVQCSVSGHLTSMNSAPCLICVAPTDLYTSTAHHMPSYLTSQRSL